MSLWEVEMRQGSHQYRQQRRTFLHQSRPPGTAAVPIITILETAHPSRWPLCLVMRPIALEADDFHDFNSRAHGKGTN